MLKKLWYPLLVATLSNAHAMMTGDETTGPDNSSTPTTTAGEITIHHITVGHVMNAFQPNSVQAKQGDIIQFTFHSGNHSVIRAAYGYPCIPYELINQNSPGFYSGVVTVNDSSTLPTWRLTVNNTDPVFFYGGSTTSCYANGMVGVINANNGTDLTKQIALAKQERYQMQPGETMPAVAIASLASIASTATANPSSKSASDSQPLSSQPGQMSSSIIAAIVVSSIVLVAGIAALFFFLGRARRRRNTLREQHWQAQPDNHTKPEYHASPHYSQKPFEQARHIVSPMSPQPIPPAYAATTELKSPCSEQNVTYLGTQQHTTPSHIIYTEHSGFTDTHPHIISPTWPQPTRQSGTSELDAGSTMASRTSPGYGRVQELDAKPLHHPAIDPPKHPGYM